MTNAAAQAAGYTICDNAFSSTAVIVVGTPGPDWMVGGADNDTLDGQDGNDLLCGRGGNDDLRGLSGNDQMFGVAAPTRATAVRAPTRATRTRSLIGLPVSRGETVLSTARIDVSGVSGRSNPAPVDLGPPGLAPVGLDPREVGRSR